MFPSDCWDTAVCSAFQKLTQKEPICSPSWCLRLHSVFSSDVCHSYESNHCSSMCFFLWIKFQGHCWLAFPRFLETCGISNPQSAGCTPPYSPSLPHFHCLVSLRNLSGSFSGNPDSLPSLINNENVSSLKGIDVTWTAPRTLETGVDRVQT